PRRDGGAHRIRPPSVEIAASIEKCWRRRRCFLATTGKCHAKSTATCRRFDSQVPSKLAAQPTHQFLSYARVATLRPPIKADPIVTNREVQLGLECRKTYANVASAPIRKGMLYRVGHELIEDQAH